MNGSPRLLQPMHRMLRRAVLALAISACLGDPAGPGVVNVSLSGAPADSVWIGGPGEAVSGGVRIVIADQAGNPVPGATLTWVAVGRGASVVAAAKTSDAGGSATAQWVLGTDATEDQRLLVTVTTLGQERQLALSGRAVPYIVSQLRLTVDTSAELRLGDTLALHVDAVDPYGNIFPAPALTVSAADSSVATAIAAGVVGGPRRGVSRVRLSSQGQAVEFPIHVTQYVAAITPSADTIRLTSLGADAPMSYVVTDDRGRTVADTAATLVVEDSAVAEVDAGLVRGRRVGATPVHVSLGTASARVIVQVRQRVASLSLWRDTVRFDALYDTTTLRPWAKDSLGYDIPDPAVIVSVTDTTVARLIGPRTLQALMPGLAMATVQDVETGLIAARPLEVEQRVTSVEVGTTFVFDALGDTARPFATAYDKLGSRVHGSEMTYSVSDPTVAVVDSGPTVRAVGPGQATLYAVESGSGIVGSAPLIVAQRVASLNVGPDSVTFDAVGDSIPLLITAQDRLGAVIANPSIRIAITDSTTARMGPSQSVLAMGQGSAFVIAADSATGVADTVLVRVWQRPVSIGLMVAETAGFSFARAGDSVGVVWANDRNGFRLPHSRLHVQLSDPVRVQVDSLGTLRAQQSGVTSLAATIDTFNIAASIVVVRPVEVLETEVAGFQIVGKPDSITVGPPTALLMPDGTTRLFFTGYAPDPRMNPPFSGDLHYATSSDGVHFTYVGIALPRDSSFSGLRSQGVENVFIVPRDDGPGCRMYAAAGATWWIWQVFSAVSDDCDRWTWEDGPAVPGVVESDYVRRGTGEGIYVWQDSVGTWWMLMGAHSLEVQDDRVWTVGLYRGTSQRQWEFVRTVFRPGPAGSGRDRAVFAPSVVEFAPGVYRMFFAGDNYTFDPVAGNSRIWSAVSRDRFNWVFEGAALDLGLSFGGASYPTVVGDKLYVQVRAPSDLGGLHLSAARISQP